MNNLFGFGNFRKFREDLSILEAEDPKFISAVAAEVLEQQCEAATEVLRYASQLCITLTSNFPSAKRMERDNKRYTFLDDFLVTFSQFSFNV